MTGQTISHFRVLDKLGGGGMGVVYVAEDLHLDRRVALKFLPSHLSTDEEAKQRFIQEAKAASALNHPNVCTIYEIGHTDEGQTFIAMAFYEGETLKDKLERGAVPTEEAFDIARQVAEGLAAAHDKDIVHRDIKPANIFITERGRAVILDFGLAKLTGALDLTKSGSTLGTAYYMSPEQVRAEHVDHRTDIWSLGVVLYEMLAGQRPFTGDYEQAISYAILNEEPPRLMNQSALVEGITRAALRKDPQERTESAATLAKRLKTTIAQSSATDSVNASPVEATLARRARLKVPLLFIGIAGIAAVVLAAFFLRSSHDEVTPDESLVRIVVLPFSNLGPPDYAFMGSGIAEDIATRLMAVRQLEIRASRSAARLVEDGKSYNEIGDMLNVDFILDGSLQATETQARLSPKLIRTSDEVQVWADTYDGSSAAALDFQAKVASAVAEALGIALGTEEQQSLKEKLTDNDEAYRAFLRGEAAVTRSDKLTFYGQAVRSDPDFVKAHVRLARYHARAYFDRDLEMSKGYENAMEAVNNVRALSPESAESDAASGFVEYYINEDYAAASGHFEDALRRNPSDSDIWEALGLVRARLGLFEEAVDALQRALTLDPTRSAAAWILGGIHFGLGHEQEAHRWVDKAISIEPLDPNLYYNKAQYYSYTGDAARARAVLETAPPDDDKVMKTLMWIWRVHIPERDFDSILQSTEGIVPDVRSSNRELDLLRLRGVALHYTGGEARDTWNLLIAAVRDRDPYWKDLHLSTAYAGLGRLDSLFAMHELMRRRNEHDQMVYPFVLDTAALNFMIAGEHEHALDALEELASLRYRREFAYAAELELFWFDPLRDNPRFQALVVNWERRE